jgi:hypothetical protein
MTENPLLCPQALPWGRRLAVNLSCVAALGFLGALLSYCGASDKLILAVLLTLALPINLGFAQLLRVKSLVVLKGRAMGAGR